MRTVRLIALLAALLALLVPGLAFAASIPRLDGSVTDQAGVLDGRVGAVQTSLADLLRDHDVQLFVLFVDTTQDLTVTQFADETARVNSLGANDALLVVAVTDRTDAIWASDGLPDITDQELDAIIADAVEPALRSGDFAGAAIAGARALGEAAGATPIATPAASAKPTPAAEPDGGGSINLGPILGLSLVAVGGVMLIVWLISRLGRRRAAEELDRQTGQLAREANSLLVTTDERMRTAGQEADFVEAEFGEAEAKPFRAAIAEAGEELRAAFAIRQRLDDSEPEAPPAREAMLHEIVEHCRRAGAALDRQAARIAELRQLERDAPTILAALPAQVEAQEQRLPGAEATLAGLQGYAEATWSSVKGNVAEARKGLAGARAAVDRGNAAVAAGDNRTAAHAIATAQEGIQGAAALIDAVDKLAATVSDAAARLTEELRAADADLGAARAAIAAARGGAAPGAPGMPGGAAAPAAWATQAAGLAGAEEAYRAASSAAAATPLDPLAAYRLAASARRGAGEVLAAIRRDAEQEAQFAAALETSLASASADIDRAADFIATRRAGVGREARTRLAEAQRSLESATALRSTDARGAMEAAQRAERLAEQAYTQATFDFARWDRGGPSPVGGGGADVAGAILGGILGGILSGGGRGGGWGGSQWGSPGPFGGNWGGGGWGGGHSRGGGFSGPAGGGGGGGHSRGGRW